MVEFQKCNQRSYVLLYVFNCCLWRTKRYVTLYISSIPIGRMKATFYSPAVSRHIKRRKSSMCPHIPTRSLAFAFFVCVWTSACGILRAFMCMCVCILLHIFHPFFHRLTRGPGHHHRGSRTNAFIYV